MIEPSYSKGRRIAVTTRGESPDAQVYERFGRTYWLLIYDPLLDSWEAIDNRFNRNLMKGVGVATAEELIRSGVAVVITGETGPKAYRTLAGAGVKVVQDVAGTAYEAVQDWLAGEMSPAREANDAGSPSCLMGATLAAHKQIFSTSADRNEIEGG